MNYKFRNPIKCNGEEVSECEIDFEKLSVKDFIDAQRKSSGLESVSLQEGDYSFHLYVAFYAIMRSNKNIDVTDLERLTGSDLFRLSSIGRNFALASLAG